MKKPKFKNPMLIDGILLVDKPVDWTSHDVCSFVRKRFRIQKVGHAGTLDPMASGLLVILLGRGTKQSMQLTACNKEYEGVMRLGMQTDSHDRTGEVTGEKPWEGVSLEDVREKAAEFTGEITQVPPMISALKHKGVRLYKLARKGKEVPREGRKVRVHALDIREKDGPMVSFRVEVSKGTYVRTLIHDLGGELGCLATLHDLRRIRSGKFHVSSSVNIDTLRDTEPEKLREIILPLRSLAYASSQSA